MVTLLASMPVGFARSVSPQPSSVWLRRQWPSSSSSSRSGSSEATVGRAGFAAGSPCAAISHSSSSNSSRTRRPLVSQGKAISAKSSPPSRTCCSSRTVVSSRSAIRMPGCRSRALRTSAGSMKGAMVGIAPSRSRPAIGAAPFDACSTRSAAMDRSTRARATTSSPIGVIRTCWRSRSTSCTPSWRSSSWMPPDSVDWVTNEASAAWVKFSFSESFTR